MGRHTETCPKCKGSGKSGEKDEKTCSECKGDGEVDVWTSGM